jgi:hypothetical protein
MNLTFELVGKTEPGQQRPFSWLSYSRLLAFHGKRPGVLIPDLSTIDVEIDRVEVLAEVISSRWPGCNSPSTNRSRPSLPRQEAACGADVSCWSRTI